LKYRGLKVHLWITIKHASNTNDRGLRTLTYKIKKITISTLKERLVCYLIITVIQILFILIISLRLLRVTLNAIAIILSLYVILSLYPCIILSPYILTVMLY